MSDLSGPGAPGMTRVEVTRGEDLVLLLKGTSEFRERQPEIFGALVDSTASVNRRKAGFSDGRDSRSALVGVAAGQGDWWTSRVLVPKTSWRTWPKRQE
jgi:hypothetical protein